MVCVWRGVCVCVCVCVCVLGRKPFRNFKQRKKDGACAPWVTSLTLFSRFWSLKAFELVIPGSSGQTP